MTPTTVVTGFLGTGKTTVIRRFLEQAPPGERWAVLVNELGEVGIDAATLNAPGLVVREVAGGCICCSVAVPFRVAVTQILRDVRPDRLLIEPSGLADPTALIDALRGPYLRDVVDLRATVGLVHPVRAFDSRVAEHPVFRAQLACADVVVGTFADTVGEDALARFIAMAEALDPPKLAVQTAASGSVDAAWLERRASPRQWGAAPGVLFSGDDHGLMGRGWVFPPSSRFDADALQDVLLAMARPGDLLRDGVVRLKGIFRCKNRWQRVDATADSVRWQPVLWRRDSRIQVWVHPSPDVAWSHVEAALQSALMT